MSKTSVLTEEREGTAIASDAKGRTLVGATYTTTDGRGRLSVHRLEHDGTLDASFGSGGTAVIDVDGSGQELYDILVDGTRLTAT